eukprot:UN02907
MIDDKQNDTEIGLSLNYENMQMAIDKSDNDSDEESSTPIALEETKSSSTSPIIFKPNTTKRKRTSPSSSPLVFQETTPRKRKKKNR